MPESKTTNQCDQPAAYRYTWPGKDEAYICAGHAPKLRAVANAMGLHLQLIQMMPVIFLEDDHPSCQQQVSK